MSTQAQYSPGHAVTRDAGVGGTRENRLVVGANDNTVVEAGAAATRVVGVAKYTVAAGVKVTVERGMILQVVYSAAANFGDKLVTTANGEVAPAGATPDARTPVGHCEQTIAAPGLGWAYIKNS